jgi:hypothetical protein
MRLRFPAATVLALIAVCVAACEGNSSLERHMDRFLRESGQGLLGMNGTVQNLNFPEAPGLVNVSVRNIQGDVRIRGQRKEADGPTTVRLRPMAQPGSPSAAATTQLEDLKWDAQMKPQPDGSRLLELTLSTTDSKAWFVRCDIEIDTPRLGSAQVFTDHGRVLVEDNRGGVRVNTTFGDVRMRTPWPITDPCRIDVKDGDVEWIVRGESSGAFDCESVGGKVSVYARYGRWIAKDPRNDHDSLVATLNSGTNPVVVRAQDGDISIVIVEDPHDTGTFAHP